MSQQLIANNGTAQSEKIIHFGLGSLKEIDELEIKWPSGSGTVLNNVKAGFLTIEESKPTTFNASNK